VVADNQSCEHQGRIGGGGLSRLLLEEPRRHPKSLMEAPWLRPVWRRHPVIALEEHYWDKELGRRAELKRHGQAALSGSKPKAPGSAGGYLLRSQRVDDRFHGVRPGNS
jgi:hypothetical protein